MRIGELAERVGVATDTLRFYERSGWLPRPERRENAYREYDEADVEHIRLLIDLRRLEIPLDDAARIATWCHTGHCGDTTAELPVVIARQRADIADRMAGLRELDARLESLQRHLVRARPALNVLADGAPCCDVAHAVLGNLEGTCACCRSSSTDARGPDVTTHRPRAEGKAVPSIELATRVEYVGGTRDGQIEDRGDLPETIAAEGGVYRRSVRCAEDGAMRYVWHDTRGAQG